MKSKIDDAEPGDAALAPQTDATEAVTQAEEETPAVVPEEALAQAWPEPENDGPAFDPRLETLRGDLRDVMLGRIRTTRKPWEQMTEAEQTDMANGIDLAAGDMIRRMVRLLTSFEWPHAAVVLGEVKIKGEKGVEAKIACPNVEHNRNVLGDHVGQHVMVLMVDSDTFMAERAPVKITPDQPALELEDGDGIPDPAQPDLPIDEPGPELEPATADSALPLEG